MKVTSRLIVAFALFVSITTQQNIKEDFIELNTLYSKIKSVETAKYKPVDLQTHLNINTNVNGIKQDNQVNELFNQDLQNKFLDSFDYMSSTSDQFKNGEEERQKGLYNGSVVYENKRTANVETYDYANLYYDVIKLKVY